MAILSNGKFYGFLCSVKETGRKLANGVKEYVEDFVSGFSGWMIDKLGNAEFKSIYCRDKFITNEFVFNRIRVTEDEEVITSNGKILSAIDNENGTWTVFLDLREGDINPFADGDLLQGYYHAPGETGVIYAIQQMTLIGDPSKEDQSMLVGCEVGCNPYPYMIVVRVGNNYDIERQAFIKISSRTNSQYFYDEITSFADLDNPDKIKCVLGKVDINLIPTWARKTIESVKKWFGLIADGVILRGIFILQSTGKSVDETITEVETRFEIKEGQISSSVQEVRTYAENAKKSEENAENSANSASESILVIESLKSSIDQTAGEIELNVSNITEKVNEATGILQEVTEKESSINQTANDITLKVTEVQTYASDAKNSADSAEQAKTIAINKASEATQTADGFQSTVTEVTKKAVEDAVSGSEQVIEEMVGTQVTQSAREWKVEILNGQETVIASINADSSGVIIQGEKVKITGQLLTEIILATGLNIQDKFVVTVDEGQASVKMKASLSLPYEVVNTTGGTISPMMIDLSKGTYIISNCRSSFEIPTLKLPIPDNKYNGLEVRIFSGFRIGRVGVYQFNIIIDQNQLFFYPGYTPLTNTPIAISKVTVSGREIVLRCISYDFEDGGGSSFWYIENYNDFSTTDFNQSN